MGGTQGLSAILIGRGRRAVSLGLSLFLSGGGIARRFHQ